jgi:hypothetical protein
MDDKEETLYDKIIKHKYKCILSLLFIYHIIFPRWNNKSWLYNYIDIIIFIV